MRSAAFLIAALFAAPALAQLPPPTPEEKAQAAEIAARNAWNDKVGLFQLCRAQDRTAAMYHNNLRAADKPVAAPPVTAACVDPGPYVSPTTPASAKPLEAAESHSPAEMAVTPPSTQATSAETAGRSKR